MTAVLFDLFGVFLKPRTETERIRVENAVGADARIWPIYEELRPAYDRGDIGDERFWRQLQVRAGLEPLDIYEAVVADWATSIEANPEMVELFDSLDDSDICAGVLANIPLGLAKKVQAKHRWLDYFDAVVFSCDIGVIKPDPRMYAVAVDAMGVHAKDIIYFSDNPRNVLAAQEAGLQAILFTGPDCVRAALA